MNSVTTWTILLFCLFFASCSFDEKRYHSLTEPFFTAQVIPPDSKSIPFLLESEKPTQISILSEKKPLTIQVQPGERFTLPIDEIYKKENPKIILRPRGTLEFSATAHLEGPFVQGFTKRHFVRISNMQSQQKGLVTAFYKSNRRQQTLRFLRRTTAHENIVKQVTGFTPEPIGLVVLPAFEASSYYWVADNPTPLSIWPYEDSDLKDESFDNANIHEWIEGTLGHELQWHSADSKARNRVFNDGLAEYGEYLFTGNLSNLGSIEKLLAAGITHIDLTQDFQSVRVKVKGPIGHSDILGKTPLAQLYSAAGYPLSSLFWIQLTQQHGADLTARFCQALKQQNKRDFPASIKLLEKITGEKDLKQRITHLDLQQALETLEILKD